MELLAEMVAHAVQVQPLEACGLVVAMRDGKKQRLVRARNVAPNPRHEFDLCPDAWLALATGEDVVGIYHSHPFTSPEPSMADRVGCENTGLPWHIVTPAGGYQYFEPSGFEAPYLKRPYVYGTLDCYTLIRDWYRRECGITLPEFHRPPKWWEKGMNLYVDNFEAVGFISLHGQVPQRGDLFLIQMFSPVPNHSAICLGDGMILHHVQDRLSTREVWGGMWERHMTHHLRHASAIGDVRG